MAKSKTYQGKPKKLGQKGFFYESNRHALSSKGIKSGTTNPTVILPKEDEPVMDLGILETDDKDLQDVSFQYEFETDVDEPVAEEIEIEGDEIEIKEPKGNVVKDILKGFKTEKKAKSKEYKRKAYEHLGIEDDVGEEETEFVRGEKFGKFIADLMGTYHAEDFAELTNPELEELAIRFDSATGEGLFGKPYNPYKDELKKRIIAEEKLKLEKQKIQAELEPMRQSIKKDIQNIRESQQERGWLIQDIKDFWGLK